MSVLCVSLCLYVNVHFVKFLHTIGQRVRVSQNYGKSYKRGKTGTITRQKARNGGPRKESVLWRWKCHQKASKSVSEMNFNFSLDVTGQKTWEILREHFWKTNFHTSRPLFPASHLWGQRQKNRPTYSYDFHFPWENFRNFLPRIFSLRSGTHGPLLRNVSRSLWQFDVKNGTESARWDNLGTVGRDWPIFSLAPWASKTGIT